MRIVPIHGVKLSKDSPAVELTPMLNSMDSPARNV